jgi:hypothetical protein
VIIKKNKFQGSGGFTPCDPPEYNKVVSGMPYVSVCYSLASEQFDTFYSYSVFMNLSVLDLCPVNMNIITPKVGALQAPHEKQNCNFLKKWLQ